MNINIYKSPQMCLYYESNTNSCCIPAGILPESMESGHSCRIPGFLLDSGGIPGFQPDSVDSGRNQWGTEKFCSNTMQDQSNAYGPFLVLLHHVVVVFIKAGFHS